jgi:hypothetical protein
MILHSLLEYGRRVKKDGMSSLNKEGNSIYTGKGTESVVGRSINRKKEVVTVEKWHGPIVIYKACVSVALVEHVKKD